MRIDLIFAIFLFAFNLLTFFIYSFDKAQSKNGGERVPEKILLLLAFCFGSVGAILAMKLFRHKTDIKRDPSKKIFVYGVPFAFISQAAILLFWNDFRQTKFYMGFFVLYWIIAIVRGLSWVSSKQRNKRR